MEAASQSLRTMDAQRRRPIGVFDSGIGGLTVAAAIHKLLPAERIVYIGDTARVPYGGKSAETVERYGLEIGRMLLEEGAKIIVVACNTASALAVPRMRTTFPVPVLGVIQPGAEAAIARTRIGRIGVIGTRATVASRAYEEAIRRMAPEVRVVSAACPLLVPLIEEGMFEDAITDQILTRYLAPLIAQGVDTLVLGCTHYPLAGPAIARAAGEGVTLLDSAANCALAVKSLLGHQQISAPKEATGALDVSLTDATEGFLRLAETTLGIQIGTVRLRAVPKEVVA